MLMESNERRLIPPAFFALVFQSELQYRYLNARINTGDDGVNRVKIWWNFCLVTPEMTQFICVSMYLYWAKIDLHTLIRRAAIK